MNHVKKLGRKPVTCYLLSGDRVIDEIRMHGILLVNGKTPTDAARDLEISESAVSKYLNLKARSRRFFQYIESLSKSNNIIVQRVD